MNSMTREQHAEVPAQEQDADVAVRTQPSERPIVLELVNILGLHPGGLRRWSVMRAIRNERERASRDVPQKFEADVERIFRRFCAGTQARPGEALFYRPQEKAGEVWAVFPDRAEAWLEAQQGEAG